MSDELAAVCDRHRAVLQKAVTEYRWQLLRRTEYLEPGRAQLLRDQAERRIEALQIDPVRHRDLDIRAYLAVRDGLPLRYDARQRVFIARRGRDDVTIRPNSAERRLGIVARLATAGVALDQIVTVATAVAAPANRTFCTRPGHR